MLHLPHNKLRGLLRKSLRIFWFKSFSCSEKSETKTEKFITFLCIFYLSVAILSKNHCGQKKIKNQLNFDLWIQNQNKLNFPKEQTNMNSHKPWGLTSWISFRRAVELFEVLKLHDLLFMDPDKCQEPRFSRKNYCNSVFDQTLFLCLGWPNVCQKWFSCAWLVENTTKLLTQKDAQENSLSFNFCLIFLRPRKSPEPKNT